VAVTGGRQLRLRFALLVPAAQLVGVAAARVRQPWSRSFPEFQ